MNIENLKPYTGIAVVLALVVALVSNQFGLFDETVNVYMIKGLDLYCETPKLLRLSLRNYIESHSAHRVSVICFGDAP